MPAVWFIEKRRREKVRRVRRKRSWRGAIRLGGAKERITSPRTVETSHNTQAPNCVKFKLAFLLNYT